MCVAVTKKQREGGVKERLSGITFTGVHSIAVCLSLLFLPSIITRIGPFRVARELDRPMGPQRANREYTGGPLGPSPIFPKFGKSS